jgi:hypothetical protein
MTEHSIENLIDNIFNIKTKEYFREVTQTYYTSCFRSSVVMLYSIVICDLIFKLEELRDIYNDNIAKKILLEIESLQTKNPTSSTWEKKLVEMISERTTLLEISDIENINQLQKHRHLSAHPVLNQTSILFKPNKDTVKSHIRNMLEGVLTKPPILSARIFNELIDDLSNNKDRFSEDKELERFLFAKYFKNLRKETLNDIFKKLWKLIFKLENEECNNNRLINFKTLEIIYNINSGEILNLIKNEQLYFNGTLRGVCMNYLFKLLFKYPKIYNSLSDLLQADIEYEIKNNIKYLFLGWFKYTDFDSYHIKLYETLEKMKPFSISKKTYNDVKSLYTDYDSNSNFIDLNILIFSKSNLYDTADYNFFGRLEILLKHFTETQLIKLLDAVENNYQVAYRGMAKTHNKRMKVYFDEVLGEDFDYSKYRHFKL